MSDSTLPSAPLVTSTDLGEQQVKQEDTPILNGSPAIAPPDLSLAKSDTDVQQKKEEDVLMQDAPNLLPDKLPVINHGDAHDDAAESEAETLIESPVKRREAERLAAGRKHNKPPKSRIGGLPVPADDDEDTSTPASPRQSVETGELSPSTNPQVARGAIRDADRSQDHVSSSDALSSPRSPDSHVPSQASSRSRAHSERGDDSPNPRKRKHRASSVSLPNKRQSMEPPKRTTRGATVEDQRDHDGSSSPKLRSHRRAVSTQSAMVEGNHDRRSSSGNNHKRRGHSQIPGRESKNAKTAWEESDASSETASHGHTESKRLPRGVGRSTPGRQGGREHKRHINKYGFTRLAEACESGDLDAVKEWREKDPDQLELAEFAQNKPLQIAALNGNEEIVSYLIEQGCQIDCANVDQDTPLIDAAENGHLGTVKILLDAGVNPLRQNRKGQQALDVVTDETEDADAIRAVIRRAIEAWNNDGAKQRLAEDDVQRHQASTSKGLHFMARNYDNLLKLVTLNDRSGVQEFLDARVAVDNSIITAAAKTGDLYLLNMLLAEMSEQERSKKAEKPLFAALGTSHFDMVKFLTELDQFNPLYRSRTGKTWPEIAEEKNGPNVRLEKELLEKLHNAALLNKSRRSSSPVTKRDSLKRRSNQHRYADESGEDEETNDRTSKTKRKNGRRLMSRRDMRAASGKAASESEAEADDSASEDDEKHEETPEKPADMQPPISPRNNRTSITRQRTKSMSSQAPNPTMSQRRRSSTARDLTDVSLPSIRERSQSPTKPIAKVDETMEDVDDVGNPVDDMDKDEKRSAKDELAEQKAAAEVEAMRRAEEDRRTAEEAQARAQAEAEAKAKEEAEAKAQAEAEMIAARQAEEEQQRETARLAQAAEDAKIHLRDNVLRSLPSNLAHVLHPDSSFQYQTAQDVHFIREHFTPLLLVKGGGKTSMKDGELNDQDSWVVNVQAAPLIGKKGLELLYRHEDIASEKTFSQHWNTYSAFSAREQNNVDTVLQKLVRDSRDSEEDDGMELDDFQAELAYLARLYNAEKAAERALRDGTIALYCVRLADVMENLDPLLLNSTIHIQPLDWIHQSAALGKEMDKHGVTGLHNRTVQGFWRTGRQEVREIDRNFSSEPAQAVEPVEGSTKVTVVDRPGSLRRWQYKAP